VMEWFYIYLACVIISLSIPIISLFKKVEGIDNYGDFFIHILTAITPIVNIIYFVIDIIVMIDFKLPKPKHWRD